MKTIVVILAFTGAVMLLSGCVITPPSENHHHHNSNTITRNGVTLPNCETLADASQADNGSRCWYR